MKKNMWILIGIVTLFVGTNIVPFSIGKTVNNNTVNFHLNGNIFYVGGSGPGNYSSIQNAIDYASDGDTVFVFSNTEPYEI